MGALKYHLPYTFLKVLVQFMKIIKSGEEKKKQTPQALPVIFVFQVFFPPQSLFYYFGFFTSHMFCLCVTQRLVKWRNDPL